VAGVVHKIDNWIGVKPLKQGYKPDIGDVVFFPAFLLRHGVKEVKSGVRISFLNHFSLLSEEDSLSLR
jgi:hypothetical protein